MAHPHDDGAGQGRRHVGTHESQVEEESASDRSGSVVLLATACQQASDLSRGVLAPIAIPQDHVERGMAGELADVAPRVGLPVAGGPKTTLRPLRPETQAFDEVVEL